MIVRLSAGLLVAGAFAWNANVGAVTLPGCQTVAPARKTLTNVRTAELSVAARPFGIVYSQQKNVAFVALNASLGVLNTSAFTPTLIHEIPLPAQYRSTTGATGITLTHDGRYALVTTFSASLIVVDTARAIAGSPDAVVDTLEGASAAGASAIEVTVTEDDSFAFVSQEDGSQTTGGHGTIEVFEFQLPPSSNEITVLGRYIGYISLGDRVVGTVLSPDNRILYATSEIASSNTTNGTLSLLDVGVLKTNPSEALISTTPAGCSPVRVIVSRDGKTVWVTARESNHLLAFDAARLLSAAKIGSPLLASVQVGTSPVGLIFAAANEGRILVADSNRFAGFPLHGNATSGLSIVDVNAALRGEQADLGQVPTGAFPREVAISPDGGTVLVTDYGSDMIQTVDVSTLP